MGLRKCKWRREELVLARINRMGRGRIVDLRGRWGLPGISGGTGDKAGSDRVAVVGLLTV